MKNWKTIRNTFTIMICFALMFTFVIADTAGAVPKGYGFTYNGATVYMNGKAKKLLKKAGRPKKKTESKSCAYEGKDRTYTFDNFIVKTYSNSDKGDEYVNSIVLLNSKVQTKEGVKVGSSKNDMIDAYGRGRSEFGVYTYSKGKCKLMIELDSKDNVSKITYLAK